MSLVDLARRLLDAAKDGNESEVTFLMSSGAPFTTDWLGTSPLHLACKGGHRSTAEVLVRAGISRDARTKVDQTPLHVSCMKGHLHMVEMLLRHEASINATDMLKMTPLHWAVERDHIAIVKYLIKHGAALDCVNKFEKTPLAIASDKGNQDMIRLLREKQSQIVVPDGDLANTQVLLGTSGSTHSNLDQATEISLANIQPVETITVNKSVFTQNAGSSTSVLATLAALAEASTPLKSPSGSHISWIDGSLAHGSQTLILTDAGKLALGIRNNDGSTLQMKEEQPSLEMKSEETGKAETLDKAASPRKKRKVDSLVAYSQANFHEAKEDGDRMNFMAGSSGDHETLTIVCADGEMTIGETLDKDQLQRQLQEAKREAEKFKQQLALKEREAENYKQKLDEINSGEKVIKKSPRKQTLETRNHDKS
ncbi:uncharacterized protein [Apostichopus japonicus]|uniref:uncharacterized protein n=1 Tax=Stichopus japonicus TaxID=307972 RepID=UPI003AB3B255